MPVHEVMYIVQLFPYNWSWISLLEINVELTQRRKRFLYANLCDIKTKKKKATTKKQNKTCWRCEIGWPLAGIIFSPRSAFPHESQLAGLQSQNRYSIWRIQFSIPAATQIRTNYLWTLMALCMIDSSGSGDACIYLLIGSAFVQVILCRLFRTMLHPELILTCCLMDQDQWNLNQNVKHAFRENRFKISPVIWRPYGFGVSLLISG